MMDVPLTIGWILEQAARSHPRREIVWREEDGVFARYTMADFANRVARLAHALIALGIGPGDRVASFAWSTVQHLELYYAVPMIGAVLHTVNVRLLPEQIRALLDHAEDRCVFVDSSLAPVFACALACEPTFDRPCIVMGDARPELPRAFSYERLLAEQPATFVWPEIDEDSAAILCYTSATTGEPKGVAFSHRSTVLHALQAALGNALDVRRTDVVLSAVPMFHVTAWGVPFVAPLVGAKLVLPGERLDAASLIELIERERVTVACGVPTVWAAVRDALHARSMRLPTLDHVHIGGSALPPRLFDDLEALGISVLHGWGMTEMSPLGAVSGVSSGLMEDAPERRREALLKQGMFLPLVAWKVVDEREKDVARNGRAHGQLFVRGHTITGCYYGEPAHPAFVNGWFATGDIVTIDEYGYMRIVDRLGDLIKSGGEWIAGVALEHVLSGHADVREVAVVGVPHPKWGERPVACIVPRQGCVPDEEALRVWLQARVPAWQVPDRFMILDVIPRTGVGKLHKRELRERLRHILADC
jgi:acyl-CoA synthetase (AMP-forming)/AMP-acid ligase II